MMTLMTDDIAAIGEYVVHEIDTRLVASEDRMEKKIDRKIQESEARLEEKIQQSEVRLEVKIEQIHEALDKKIENTKTELSEKIDVLAGEVRKIDQRQTLMEHKLRHNDARIQALEGTCVVASKKKVRAT